MSREVGQLEALKRSLAVYRMVFGQPRQEDLVAHLLEQLPVEKLEGRLQELQIDLKPRP